MDKLKKPLVAEGAMGTLSQERDITFDTCFGLLNLDQPAIVAEIHSDYFKDYTHAFWQSGARVIGGC